MKCATRIIRMPGIENAVKKAMPTEYDMGDVQRDQIERDHDKDIDEDRAQRMHRTHPVAARALDVKLLEQADAGADQDRIQGADFDGPADRGRRDQTEAGEDHRRHQDRCELSARRRTHGDTVPYSRGRKCPGDGSSVSPRNERGRRECRALNRTRSLVCKMENTRVSHHRHAETIRHSLRDGFNGLYALSSVYRAF
jgi:hypothetical protein